MTARRSYGTGALDIRTDKQGRETWYGRWWSSGRQVQRAIGPKRAPGGREGLTRGQAEAELRRHMSTVKATAPVGARMTVSEAGKAYQAHLKRLGRKRTTLAAVESALRVHLVPFFGEKSLDAIKPEDVADFAACSRRTGCRRSRCTTTSGRSRRCSTTRRARGVAG